tara:strand:- start:2519 stop:2872 length:354 start_codon:yes stop_codon:yes gene_type:complete
MKTITHKGKVYQIGGRYADENENIGLLDSCDGRTFKMSSISRGFWFCNGLRTFEVGTIEDAPLELEDGEWYVFNVGFNSFDFAGYYSEKHKSFMCGNNKVGEPEDVNNIKKMVRECK